MGNTRKLLCTHRGANGSRMSLVTLCSSVTLDCKRRWKTICTRKSLLSLGTRWGSTLGPLVSWSAYGISWCAGITILSHWSWQTCHPGIPRKTWDSRLALVTLGSCHGNEKMLHMWQCLSWVGTLTSFPTGPAGPVGPDGPIGPLFPMGPGMPWGPGGP